MKITFVIPLYNEEKNAKQILRKVVNFCNSKKLDYEIIPVDDRSFDSTAQILSDASNINKRIHPLYRKNNNEVKGNTMGKALIEGSKKAKGDIIIWTMGDLADSPATYGDIIAKLENGYDLIFGSRYMPGGSRGNLDPAKAFLSSWGTVLARILFGIKVWDITNAFRGFRRKVIKSINLESTDFAISPEMAIKAHIYGFKLGEVPTVYTNRVEGASNFKLYKMTVSYLKLYFKLLLNKNKL